MPITLNHTIVPSRDKVAAAQFFARIMGLEYQGLHYHFAPVQVNDTLTLDFDDADQFECHHYAFLVSDEEFDGILARVRAENISIGSGPDGGWDGKLNNHFGGRGFYFPDPSGHLLELMTRA
jgi:catechol 2,3-dioxygenase-like lactoylglutathione lyase family enzyme